MPEEPVNSEKVKERILQILRLHGPSLPARIAREIGMSILFASAFLSELHSENKIKISNTKVGSSPLYFLPGQEHLLERFSQYLKSKEKEAFLLLKEKKFLKDSELSPAIRVAIREIKDFAIPFRKPNIEEIFWRYFTVKEEDMPKKLIEKQVKVKKEVKKQEEKLDIFNKTEKKPITKPIKSEKPSTSKQKTAKKNEKFFNLVKDSLSKSSIEILSIEFFNTKELILKIRENGVEELLVAYNKKRINEEDIIKAHKKALESNLKYRILSRGEPLERIKKFIGAINDINKIEKI